MTLIRGRAAHAALAVGAACLVSTVMFSAPATAASPSPSPTLTVPAGAPILVLPRADATPLPNIYAASWIIADATAGEVLASRGADLPRPPASTLKVLTALALLPHLQPQSWYRASHLDANVEGSHAGIVAGGTYRVADLANGLLLPSGNDCATALAHAYGGLRPALAAMNHEAARYGASHTRAVNPSGLDAPKQVSTPRDLVTLYRGAIGQPLFRAIIGTPMAKFPGAPVKQGKRREHYAIASQDRLLLSGYPGLIGGKSGYTTNAGRTFVGGATRHGKTLVYALMGTEGATDDVSRTLLDWGFANVERVNPVGALPPLPAAATPPQPRPAAQYTTAGKLVSPPGQTAGAPSVQDVGRHQTRPISNAAVAASQNHLALDWLTPALFGFLALLAAFCVVLAARTFRRR